MELPSQQQLLCSFDCSTISGVRSPDVISLCFLSTRNESGDNGLRSAAPNKHAPWIFHEIRLDLEQTINNTQTSYVTEQTYWSSAIITGELDAANERPKG